MTKKEPIAHCNTLERKVARKQLTIEDLRKKKSWPKEDYADCKIKDYDYNNLRDICETTGVAKTKGNCKK